MSQLRARRRGPKPRASRSAFNGPGARRPGWRIVSALVSAVLVVPVVAGLVGVVVPALGYFPALGAHEAGLDVLKAFASEPGVWRSVAVSALSGFAATAAALVLTALILAAAFATRALGAAERLLAPILSVPHAAAALGFVFLFAPSGFLLRLVSPWATGLEVPPDVAILRDPWGWSLAAALVVKETPFLFLMALAALRQVRATERAAVARTLGYGPMAAFLHAVWPLVYRQIRLPVLATLAFAVSVVDMALILGPTRPAPLSVRIVGWLQSTDLADWMIGSAGAFVMALLVAALIGVWLVAERAAGWAMRAAAFSGARLTRDGALRALVLAAAGLGVAVVFCGFGGLMVQSVAGYWPFPETLPGTVTLGAWQARLPMAAGTLRATLLIALGATAIALPLAVLLLEAHRRGARVWWLIYAPLIAPQVAFLFGLNVLAIAAGIRPGAVAVTLCHALFALPYALIALSGPWAALDPRYRGGGGERRRRAGAAFRCGAAPDAVFAALRGCGPLRRGQRRALPADATDRRRARGDGDDGGGGGLQRRRPAADRPLRQPSARPAVRGVRARPRRPASGASHPPRRPPRMSLDLQDYAVAVAGRTLARLSVSVAPGEVLSVMGPSGVGKSSLLLGIAGLLAPGFTVAGSVRLHGADLLGLPPERRGVGMMFQDPLLFPHMSVLGNVMFAVPRRIGGRAARREAAMAALGRVAMADLARRDPATLSGGQHSRVALARTLAGSPCALLLDEPFSALDQALRAATRAIVFDLARQDGLPVILVSHDPEDARAANGPVIDLAGGLATNPMSLDIGGGRSALDGSFANRVRSGTKQP